MNMSYCQFENTLKNLEQCHDTLDEMVNDGGEKLSETELRYAKRLVDMCANIIELFEDTEAARGLELKEIDFHEAMDEVQENCSE